MKCMEGSWAKEIRNMALQAAGFKVAIKIVAP